MLSDDGQILIEWIVCNSTKENYELEEIYKRKNPLLVVVPGLTGDITALYMHSTIIEARKHNYDVVIVNYRGQGGLKITVINSYIISYRVQ